MQGVTTGVVFRPQSPPERLRETVEATDAAGVAELWLWEDCFLEGGLAAATAALAGSERMRIGIGLLPVALRNPALAAMEIATVARLFPDRFVPGLGHGALDWPPTQPPPLLRAEVDAGRAAAGRTDPCHVVVYVEPPADLPDDELTDLVGRSVRDLGGAGATSVVFTGSPAAPDPAPLLRALTASGEVS